MSAKNTIGIDFSASSSFMTGVSGPHSEIRSVVAMTMMTVLASVGRVESRRRVRSWNWHDPPKMPTGWPLIRKLRPKPPSMPTE
jgi:hypothetical protein